MPILRGKYLDERLRYSRKEAADNHIRCHVAAGGSMLATLAPSLITPCRCRIRRLINRSSYLSTSTSAVAFVAAAAKARDSSSA